MKSLRAVTLAFLVYALSSVAAHAGNLCFVGDSDDPSPIKRVLRVTHKPDGVHFEECEKPDSTSCKQVGSKPAYSLANLNMLKAVDDAADKAAGYHKAHRTFADTLVSIGQSMSPTSRRYIEGKFTLFHALIKSESTFGNETSCASSEGLDYDDFKKDLEAALELSEEALVQKADLKAFARKLKQIAEQALATAPQKNTESGNAN